LLSLLRFERGRRKKNQLHTKGDTSLLLLTALTLVGMILCPMFFVPSNSVVNSRAGVAATIVVVGGALTYVFNAEVPLIRDGWRTIAVELIDVANGE